MATLISSSRADFLESTPAMLKETAPKSETPPCVLYSDCDSGGVQERDSQSDCRTGSDSSEELFLERCQATAVDVPGVTQHREFGRQPEKYRPNHQSWNEISSVCLRGGAPHPLAD